MTRMSGFTQADADRHQTKHGKGNVVNSALLPPSSKNKHGNHKVADENGEIVDSKLEARHRADFRQQLRMGAIKAYARQPEIMLPGGVKMIPDHLVIENDGAVKFYDSKGRILQDWKNKQKQAKACLGIDVQVIR